MTLQTGLVPLINVLVLFPFRYSLKPYLVYVCSWLIPSLPALTTFQPHEHWTVLTGLTETGFHVRMFSLSSPRERKLLGEASWSVSVMDVSGVPRRGPGT